MLHISFIAKLVTRCVYALVAVPLLCFGFSDRVYHSIQEAWVYDLHGDYLKAIDICNNELADPELEDVDRMHVLMARSMFWMALDRQNLYLEDQHEVLLLKRKSAECAREWALNYD